MSGLYLSADGEPLCRHCFDNIEIEEYDDPWPDLCTACAKLGRSTEMPECKPPAVPADWIWSWCRNGCGDIVWIPDVRPVEVPITAVCSANCAMEIINKLPELA